MKNCTLQFAEISLMAWYVTNFKSSSLSCSLHLFLSSNGSERVLVVVGLLCYLVHPCHYLLCCNVSVLPEEEARRRRDIGRIQ